MFERLKNMFGTSEPAATSMEPAFEYTPDADDGVTVKFLKEMGNQLASSDGYSGFGFTGEKFPGGLDPGFNSYGWDFTPDYDLLQRRSAILFETNLYARGILRRLITNEITTGLQLEATPEESVIGVPEDSLEDWSENVETRFTLWGKTKDQASYTQDMTFAQIQRQIRMESLIAGDVLVILHSEETGLPSVEIVRGERVRTPLTEREIPKDRRIEQGVELDRRGRQVAYWVLQEDGSARRIPARGRRTGRRTAWLVYGTEKRTGRYRGEPMLSLIIQSLKEIDRYRDSAQRKALVNSLLALFIQKDEDKPGTKPLSNGAVRKGTATVSDTDGQQRTFKMADSIPGMAIETLQHGEKPVAFGNDGTDINFGPFEESIIQGIAWGYEIPPEILRLAFSNNYSASQAAINEFKIYLNRVRTEFGENVCQPVYQEWLLAQVMLSKINNPEILRAFQAPAQRDVFAAWTCADWAGAIKPSTDIKKMADGYTRLIDQGLITRDRSAKETTGTKFSKNIKKLRKENEQMAEAMRPVLELKAEFGEEEVDAATANAMADLDERIEALEEVENV